MFLKNKRKTIFTGHYGSGKTEIALNFALGLKEDPHKEVTLIDLDLVNPYFRSQEAKKILEEKGIRTIVPPEEMHSSDLPIIVREAFEAFSLSEGYLIIDVGGDDQGVLALGQFRQWLNEGEYDFWLVVNPYRPFNDRISGIFESCQRIETASRLRLTGLISNPHLGRETTPEIIAEGHTEVIKAAEALKLPVKFLTVHEKFINKIDSEKFKQTPLFPINILVYPDWLSDDDQ